MTELDRQIATTEYVVGRPGGASILGSRALGWAIDDLTRDLGDDIYERMLLDPVVLAAVNVMRASILAEGLMLSPAVDDPEADGYERSKEIHAFCESVLADLEVPLDDVLWDLTLAIALGSRVAEEVYALDRGRLVIRAIKVRPRRSTVYIVDPYQNVQGLAYQMPGLAGPIWVGATFPQGFDPQTTPGVLPREKFVVLTFRPANADPRGTSIIRPAYGPWWVKQQTWPELLKYLAQFASPSLIGTVAEKAGTVVAGGAKTDPIAALLSALNSFKNGSTMALPYGTVVDVIRADGGGDAFFRTMDMCDRQITTAVLHQTLATLEGQHQTRAAAETHKDILGTIIRQARRAVATTIRRDVLRPLVRYNYGDAALPLVPRASFGEVEQTDLPGLARAVADLARAQFIHPSQYAGLDEMLGLPPRDLDSAVPAAPPLTPEPNPDDADDDADPEEQS